MMVIRTIEKKDQTLFSELACDKLLGITNLPIEQEKLLEKIAHSEKSFSKEVTKPEQEEYYFVMEDLNTGKIGGICGILANARQSHLFCYKILSLYQNSKHLYIPKILQLIKVFSTPGNRSEVCSLYLLPNFRHSGHGRLLSLSRFLFIAAHRHRFAKHIVAELRGYNSSGKSPFWSAVGAHFCHLSFEEVMAKLNHDRSFISDFIPKYPIYISLLPQEAQEAIGKVHEETKPAFNMLMNEGFQMTNQIDIFDGGPTLLAKTASIRSVKESALIKIEITQDSLVEENEYLLSNERIDFKVCSARLYIKNKQWGVIHSDVAQALNIKKGDTIRYVSRQ